MSKPKTPAVLDRVVDRVLAYRPKPKSVVAKKKTREGQEKSSAGVIYIIPIKKGAS